MKIAFTPSEHASIIQRLRSYSPAVDPIAVEFWWVKFWFKSTCGMFRPVNKICMSLKDKLAIMDGVADDVICHELVHMRQYREQGKIMYALNNLLKLNEQEAYAEQERVRKIIEG